MKSIIIGQIKGREVEDKVIHMNHFLIKEELTNTEVIIQKCKGCYLNSFYTNEEGIILTNFTTTIKVWPFSLKGELIAVILAVLTTKKNSKITIYTDSLNMINLFVYLKKI